MIIRTIYAIALLAAVAALGTDAQAQSATGKFYGKANLGYSFTGDANIDAIPAVSGQTIKFDDGVVGSFGVGYMVNRVLSAEAEVGYRSLAVNSVSVGGARGADVSGDVSALTFQANIIASFGKAKIKPFLGGGLGMALVNFEDYRVTAGGGRFTAAGKSRVLSYQFIGGVDYMISDKFSLGLDYRYQNVGDVEIKVITHNNTRVDAKFDGSHNFTIGAKYRF